MVEDELQGTTRTITTQHIKTVSTAKSSRVFKSSELIQRTYIGDTTTPSITRLEPIAKEMSAIELRTAEGHNGIGNRKPLKYLFPVQDPPLEPRNRVLAFTDFAPEIRNTIYKHLLAMPKVIPDREGYFAAELSQIPGTLYHEHGTMLSLRKTCRLIYEEGTELVYGQTFVFRDHNDLSGFLAQLTPALRSLPRKVFRKVVLHIGQDWHRITSTCNLLSENDKVHEILGTKHHLPIVRKKSKFELAQGWSKAILTLLHRHQVEELVLVAGSSYRALLTSMNPAKPLMRNLLANTFHVDNLTILDSKPGKMLSAYKFPKRLKAQWEKTPFSLDALDPDWTPEDDVLSADEGEAETTNAEADEDEDNAKSQDEDGTEPAAEEGPGSADEDEAFRANEEETSSADEEGTANNSSIDAGNGSDEYLGSNQLVDYYQDTCLMEDAQSSENSGILQPTMEIGGDMRIQAGGLTKTANMAIPVKPAVLYHPASLSPHASNYGYIESIGEPVSGHKRDLDVFMEDMDSLDLAVQAVPDW